MTSTILHISASTRGPDSITDLLARELLDTLHTDHSTVIHRHLSNSTPLLSPVVTGELTTPSKERSPEAADDLRFADELIDELREADILVIGAPIYNFAVPACLKAWADLVARAGTTFRFVSGTSEGLLVDRPTYLVSASGGTSIGGPEDFGTRWLTQFLRFIGIENVTVIGANQLNMDEGNSLTEARRQIRTISNLG